MKTFKLTLEYDGTDFSGWQKNPGKRTVQGELEKALAKLAGGPVATTGAGRTDTGVHAAGQVVSLEMEWERGEIRLRSAMNANLPVDLSVLEAHEVHRGFDARRDAASRSYRYTFLVLPVRSSLRERQAYRVERRPNMAMMRSAAALFRGGHDFAAFCRGGGEGGTLRHLSRCTLSRQGGYLRLDLEGKSFLRHMARSIAAAVLAAGQGWLDIGRIRAALAGGSRRGLPPMLPARGLMLTGVCYLGERKRMML